MNKICFGLALTLMLTSIHGEAGYAKSRKSSGICQPEKRPLRTPSEGESDAVCSYDIAEFNRRLANFIEMPAGGFTLDYMQKLLSMPAMRQRPDLGYSKSYKETGYSTALAGKGGWTAIIDIYFRERDIIRGRRHDLTILSRVSFPSTYADPKQSNCITEAEILDRAIAAGWRYELLSGDLSVPMEDGTSEIFTAQLSKDDGRTLGISTLPDKNGAPPRAKLESTCWIGVSLTEERILKRK